MFSEIRGDVGYINGTLGADVVDFGGDLVDLNQTFGIASSVSDGFAAQHLGGLDGVFGLGWPSTSNGKVQPPVFQILSQLDKPLFTVWLDRHVNLYADRITGQITYGAVDTQNCDADVDYVPLTKEAAWQFQWDGFAVSKSSFPVPIRHLHRRLRREESADIVLTIGGKKYSIPSSEYVFDEDLGNDQCSVAADEVGAALSFDEPAIVLGDVFLRAYCNVYDIGQKRIGFAMAHHKDL